MGDNGETKEEKLVVDDSLVKMLITFNPGTNQVQVTGPINNRVLAYGMLEMAKEAILEFKYKNQPQIQTPAKGSMFDFARRRS